MSNNVIAFKTKKTTDPHYWFNLAENHICMGRVETDTKKQKRYYTLAKNYLDEAERLGYPFQTKLYIHKSSIEIFFSRYNTAFVLIDKVLAIEPDNIVAHYNKAYCYDQAEMYTDALAWYIKTLELDPTYADACFNMAGLYYSKFGEFEDAIRWYVTTEKLYRKEGNHREADMCIEARHKVRTQGGLSMVHVPDNTPIRKLKQTE